MDAERCERKRREHDDALVSFLLDLGREIEMEFRLKNGRNVEVIFWRDKKGNVNSFPKEDVELIKKEGTEQSKLTLHNLLKGYQLSLHKETT